jgi:hypothetical protein
MLQHCREKKFIWPGRRRIPDGVEALSFAGMDARATGRTVAGTVQGRGSRIGMRMCIRLRWRS